MITEPRAEQGSPEWLAARHRDRDGLARITASVAAAIFGEHEYLSAADLAVQQLQDEPPSEEMTEEMERGRELEPVVLDHWGRKHNVEVLRPDVMHVRGRFLANLDGLARREPVEAKSTTHRFSPAAFGHKPFSYWRWQGVTQAYCYYNAPGVIHWSIFDGDMRFKEYDQEVTQDEIDQLVQAGDEWLSYIDLGMPPIGVDLTAKHMARLAPPDQGEVELPPEAAEWLRRRAEACKRIEEAEEELDEAKRWLLSHMGTAKRGLLNGQRVVTHYPIAGRKRLDRVALEMNEPDIYDKYLVTGSPSDGWRFKGEPNGYGE